MSKGRILHYARGLILAGIPTVSASVALQDLYSLERTNARNEWGQRLPAVMLSRRANDGYLLEE